MKQDDRTSGARPIVLLTDFGHEDHFVGVMKGVILGIDPRARIVDLCHGGAAQDIRSAAFRLMASAPYFPKGALFTVVVDPGVGSSRRVLWARTRRHEFLFPDNGVASWLERVEPFSEVREVSDRRLFLRPVGSTFHGRDVFAPTAARLSLGLRRERLGPRTARREVLAFPEAERRGRRITGAVLARDRFGNIVTSLPSAEAGPGGRVFFRGRGLGPVRSCYAEAPRGRPSAVAGSSGFVELFLREGDLAGRLRIRTGEKVEATRPFPKYWTGQSLPASWRGTRLDLVRRTRSSSKARAVHPTPKRVRGGTA